MSFLSTKLVAVDCIGYVVSGVGELVAVVVLVLVVVVVAKLTKSFSSAVHEVVSVASRVHLESVGSCGRLRKNVLMMSSQRVYGRAWRRIVRRG